MTDGELKKRTTPSNRGCDTDFDTQGKGCYFIKVDCETWVDKKGVHRTINEAKKDIFGVFRRLENVLDKPTDETKDGLTVKLIALHAARGLLSDYFVKWFGEE